MICHCKPRASDALNPTEETIYAFSADSLIASECNPEVIAVIRGRSLNPLAAELQLSVPRHSDRLQHALDHLIAYGERLTGDTRDERTPARRLYFLKRYMGELRRKRYCGFKRLALQGLVWALGLRICSSRPKSPRCTPLDKRAYTSACEQLQRLTDERVRR